MSYVRSVYVLCLRRTELETSHEEAVAKIILYAMHLRETHTVNVTISPLLMKSTLSFYC